jgi:putative spermidine/putrescine transport system substrate-binding protein
MNAGMRHSAFAAALLLGTVASGAALAQDEPPKPEQMVVNSSGGPEAEALNEIYFNDFTAATGIKIAQDSPDEFARLKAEVESGNAGGWAITNVDAFSAVRASALGYLEQIDPAIVDRSNFIEEAVWPDAYLSHIRAFVPAWRTDDFPDGGPQTWADFWDVEKFPGPRAMENDPRENLLAALLADGVSPKELYPLDLDRAFKKMDELYPDVAVWFSSNQQPMQLLSRKEVTVTTAGANRVYAQIQDGQPFAIGWGQPFVQINGWAIPKGAKDVYWAQKLFAFMTDPQRQAKYAEVFGMAPTNKGAEEFLPDEVKPYLPTSHLEGAYIQTRADLEWWAANGDAVYERWNKWMLSH